MRFLLVEDMSSQSLFLQKVLRSIPEHSDAEITSVSTLKECLQQAGRDCFEVILLDLGLPDSAGLNTLKAVVTQFPASAIIIVTGENESEFGLKAVHLGAQDYLIKGKYDEELLERSIRYSVERHRLLLEARAADREREELSCELAQKRRLSELNNLAAGVGHEINNPLATISLAAGLIMGVAKDGEMNQYAQDILEASRKISEVVTRLNKLAEPYTSEETEIALSVIIHTAYGDALSSCERPHPPRSDFKIPEGLKLRCVPTQMQAVFFALFQNSLDALDGRQDGLVQVECKQQQGRVLVAVADNGAGVPSHLLARVFDPFFTTKSRALGSGLGLTISRKLVLDNGGQITAANCASGGFLVRLSLPASSA